MPGIGIVAITLIAGGLLIAAIRRSSTPSRRRRSTVVATAVVLAWLACTAMLALNGFTTDFSGRPPNFVRLLLPTLVASVALAGSSAGARLADEIPLSALIAAQSLRIPVELVLWGLYRDGRLPVQMTFEGRNLDILTGVLAIVVALILRRGRAPGLVLLWNVLGLVLLVTIVAIANLSAPTPYRVFTSGPSSAVITSFPFIWLPVFIVPLALLGHLLVFRALARQRERSRPG
jgi:hypothetical protein